VINAIPTLHANTVAPYAPLGRQAVGQESTDLKTSSFKALEQAAAGARSENKRSPDEPPAQGTERQTASADGNRIVQGAGQKGDGNSKDKERLAKEQKLINELAATDREVHAHEQAHAAVGGVYAGNPTYQFVKGPNGMSYAVGGEVSISTAPIPNDPEATIRKAQQIRAAANAPADPSPQDRRVSASAVSLEAQARAELAVKEAAEAQQAQELAETKAKAQKQEEAKRQEDVEKARKQAEQEEAARQARLTASSEARGEIFAKSAKSTLDLTRHLVDIGVVKGGSNVGSLFSGKV